MNARPHLGGGGSVSESGRPFQILCVCTGNICRSPVAEQLLSHRLGPSVRVESAGTYALVGRPVAEQLASRLRDRGLPDRAFSARLLTAPMLAAADLVLALSRAHRGEAVELEPRAVRRAFTLLEFARLVETLDPAEVVGDSPAERLRNLLPLVITRRRVGSAADDVDDPFGGPDAAYEQAFGTIDDAVDRIGSALVTGSSSPTVGPATSRPTSGE